MKTTNEVVHELNCRKCDLSFEWMKANGAPCCPVCSNEEFGERQVKHNDDTHDDPSPDVRSARALPRLGRRQGKVLRWRDAKAAASQALKEWFPTLNNFLK